MIKEEVDAKHVVGCSTSLAREKLPFIDIGCVKFSRIIALNTVYSRHKLTNDIIDILTNNQ